MRVRLVAAAACCGAAAAAGSGVEVLVFRPAAGALEALPLGVVLSLAVTEGPGADGLRGDPGAHELCYGIVGGAEISCVAVGDPTVIGLAPVEARHLAQRAPGANPGASPQRFEAWLALRGERTTATAVDFVASVVEGDALPTAATAELAVDASGDPGEAGGAAGSQGDAGEAFDEAAFARGYVVVPQVVPRGRASTAASRIAGYVDEHLAAFGGRYANAMGGASMGGWYIGDCFRVAEFAHLWDVFASPQLHAVLATLLGDDFHFLERREFYVSRKTWWHSDFPFVVYFRDHDEDGKGLSVAMSDLRGLLGERVSTRAGDAVVFDARLLHRGVSDADADFSRVPGTAHRSVLSVSFGRRDAVSEAWSRGFEMRGKMFRHDTHICPKRDKLGDANINWPCAHDAADAVNLMRLLCSPGAVTGPR
ncbi:hypothetical protein M885DRAFT_567494 [Pelagophyceae sp. CCMP2097]|nr:hypothetical protein M885DRAFT_567494 [Pelagophyceae sp. CCMP2097]